jgi:hypothetical protein
MILERFILNKVNLLRHSLRIPPSRLFALDSSSVGFWNCKTNYPWFLPVQTRWKDNDQYLHMNNAVYHAIFDSVINVYLIRYRAAVLVFQYGCCSSEYLRNGKRLRSRGVITTLLTNQFK